MGERNGSPATSRSAQGWVLALASVASFMLALDALVVATSLTAIRLDLGATIEGLGWAANAYNVSFAVLLMTGAALGDRFGRRRMYVAGLVLFAMASAACALSPDIGWLIAARAVQGVGAAVVAPLALTLLSAAFPPERRGRALGIVAGLAGLATFSGPFVGGAIAEGLAWQWIFWLNVPIGLFAAFLAHRRIGESVGPNSSLDLGGLTLVTAGVLGVVWGLARGHVAGWGSLEVLTSLVAGVLLLTAFGAWERHAAAPMLPLRLFRSSAFTAGNVANFCLWGSLYGFLFLTAQYLQTALGHGPLGAGLRLMACTSALILVAPLAGALADRFGERRFMVGGLLLQTTGMASLALIADADLAFSLMVLPLVVGGIGVSMGIPTAQRAVVGAVTAAEVGQASGVVTTLRVLGGAFGIATLTAVFAGTGGLASSAAFADGFAPAIAVAAALAFVGAIAALWLPGRTPGARPLSTPTIEQAAGVTT
ncbi:MAG: DHA2 family efflux MFS transporter permease subunit [Nocardioidaceae bacterium]